MNVDVIEEADNPMLHRTDVRFEVTHEEATPSRLSVRDSLAAMLNKDATEVVVHELDTKFGMRTTVGYAKVYETPEHAQDVEQDHMLRRNKIGGNGELEEDAAETVDEDDEAAEAVEDEAEEADEPAADEEGEEADAEESEDDDASEDEAAEDEEEEDEEEEAESGEDGESEATDGEDEDGEAADDEDAEEA